MKHKRTITPKKPEASRRSDSSPSPLAIEGSPVQRMLAIEGSRAQRPLPIEGAPAQDGADASRRSDRSPSPHQLSTGSSESSGSYHSPSPVPCDREI